MVSLLFCWTQNSFYQKWFHLASTMEVNNVKLHILARLLPLIRTKARKRRNNNVFCIYNNGPFLTLSGGGAILWSFSYFWSTEADGCRLLPRVESILRNDSPSLLWSRGLYLFFSSGHYQQADTDRAGYILCSSCFISPIQLPLNLDQIACSGRFSSPHLAKKTRQEENTLCVKSVFFANDLCDGFRRNPLWLLSSSTITRSQF